MYPGAHRCQKQASDLLELELWLVVSHHVGSGTLTQILCKSNKCYAPLIHLSALSPLPTFSCFCQIFVTEIKPNSHVACLIYRVSSAYPTD